MGRLRVCVQSLMVPLAAMFVLPALTLAASVPDAQHSHCPTTVNVSIHGDACFDVTARDFAGNPVTGSNVTIDFGSCVLTYCPSQPHLGNQVSVVTNALGVAHFCICACTVSSGCTASIAADGVHLCSVPVQSICFSTIIRNVTPAAWQAADVHWVRDVSPHNHIDDLIDASANPTFDIVANYRRCVETSDIAQLNTIAGSGHVQLVLKYISSVTMTGLSKATINALVTNIPGIAFIEKQVGFGAALDVSVPAIKVTSSSTYSPNTVQDANPALNGSGVNIAIIDSGVDNPGGPGVTHDAFANTPFVGGYNALTDAFEDPDDDVEHGTHVASIALGQATANTSRGVAPAAGLIDVKVLDSSTFCDTPGNWEKVVKGLQTVYDMRDTWKVRVINMSLRQCNANGTVVSDGKDAFSQLCDLAEAMGITIVAAAGNDFPNTGISAPAAATRSITVAASDDHNTVNRTGDGIASFSNQGPRDDDGDSDCLDELKPEVTAPGVDITAAEFDTQDGALSLMGTSMAAPHVAGLAALIYQARPTIKPASVKDLIIRTCEQLGTPPSAPSCDPIWNRRWGWGLVDAYAAIIQGTMTDLTFPTYPPNPAWNSPDITTSPFPAQVGVPTTVTAVIKNAGPAVAVGARIHFGVHVYSAATPVFHDIGTVVKTLPVGNTAVSIAWTPEDVSHQCLYVEIGYSPDVDYSNNATARNLTVGMSPVAFTIQNTITEASSRIHFTTTFARPDTHWTVRFSPDTSYMLSASDCPRTISVELRPFGAAIGDTQIVHVKAIVETPQGPATLGGVSVLQVAHSTGIEPVSVIAPAPRLTVQSKVPFDGTAAIRFVLPHSGFARVSILDVGGRMIRRLVARRERMGEYVVDWNGRDDREVDVAPGVYMVSLEFERQRVSQRLLLVR